jgi:hypothetical protein
MSMSPRLLRPVASGFHPEAQVWRNAVIANGGSVSGSTVKAVSDFCKSIDAAGIRDRFYRLNLFAGTGLNAALVPLYRGPSRTGTQYGNATDTNFNFVSGDYAESSGLTPASANRHLDTGLSSSTIGATSIHLAVYQKALSGTNTINATLIGSQNNGVSQRYYFNVFSTQPNLSVIVGSVNDIGSGNTASGSTIGTREGAGARYVNGAEEATSGSLTPTGISESFFVFGNNFQGGVNNRYNRAILSYSLGKHFSASQAAAYHTAWEAVNTALGR